MLKKSLKRRFFYTLVLPVLAVLALAGIAGFYSARHEVDEIYDAQLASTAKTIMALMERQTTNDGTNIDALEARFKNTGHHYEKYTAIRLWKGGKLFFYSKSAEHFGEQHVIAGFSNKEIEGESWRFFVLPDPRVDFTVEVAEKYWVRGDLIDKILLTMFIPFLVLLPVLPVLFWLGLRYGLTPLVEISEYVKRRSPDDLSPIAIDKTPAEILPLTHEINALMARVNEALVAERRFTDLAAHELRTPLAVIKTQVQNVIETTDTDERQELLDDLKGGVERASGMVAQLLSLARLGHDDITVETLSLNETVRTIAQELSPLALAKQITLACDEKAEVTIQGNAEILNAAVRNIIENAIKYTPLSGGVTILIERNIKESILSISDTGVGIPEDKLSLVVDRFYRVPGNRETGSGLGLTITARAAKMLGARLVLQNRKEGGLTASLIWPAD